VKKEKLKTIMDRHGLGHEDIAAITGKTTRQVHSWLSGIYAVPRSLALVLYALDENAIGPGDIVRWVRRETAKT
jgi:hypothetical protein